MLAQIIRWGRPVFHPYALAYRAAVRNNGSDVSDFNMAVISDFIRAEIASGAWDLTDDYWGFWAPDPIQALTSLKQRRLATVVNSPTFNQNRDYTTNGTSSYIDLGFNPFTHSLAASTNSLHVEIYERANVSAAAVSIGCTTGSNRSIAIQARNSGNALCDTNSNQGAFPLPVNTSIGLTQTGRAGPSGTDEYAAKNGVAMTRTVTPPAVGASLPSRSLFVGAYNAGTANAFRASSFGYAAFGAALSPSLCVARANAVDVWRNAMGA